MEPTHPVPPPLQATTDRRQYQSSGTHMTRKLENNAHGIGVSDLVFCALSWFVPAGGQAVCYLGSGQAGPVSRRAVHDFVTPRLEVLSYPI